MAFDTSGVAATVGSGPDNALMNPMDQVARLAATRNALFENQLLQNQNALFQARQAAGADFQGAFNADGTFNGAGFNSALARDPSAALVAPEMFAGGAALTGANITNTTNQASLNAQRIDRLRTVIQSVPAGSPEGDYIAAVKRGADAGLYPADLAASYVGGNLTAVPNWSDLAKQSAIATGSESGQRAQGVAPPTLVDTGGTIQPTVFNPAAGTAAPLGAPIDKTLTPEASAAGVGVVGPDGTVTRVPLSGVVTPTGQQKGPPPVVGLGPGQSATLTTTGTGEANAALALQGRAADVPQRKANLDLLSNTAGEFNAGPQSGFWKGLGALAAEYGVKVPIVPTANATAANEEFNKVATMVLASQRGATGMSGTDYQSQLAGMMAPHAEMTPQGIKRVVGTLKANEDLYNAQYQLWEKAKSDPRFANLPFDQFQAKLNTSLSPLVFQAQYADPAERAKMIQQVGEAKFKAQYKALYNQGLIGGQ